MKKAVYMAVIILVTGLGLSMMEESRSDHSPVETFSCEYETNQTHGLTVEPVYSAWFSRTVLVESSCRTPADTGGLESYQTYVDETSTGVMFRGAIETNHAGCYSIEHRVREVGENSYTVHISAKAEPDAVCLTCLGINRYQAIFETEEPFELDVVHDGELVETIQHPDYEP